MNDNQTRVTVKHIEKIPSTYYVQGYQPVAGVQKKVKVEIADSLLANRKRLTDALRFRPAVGFDFSGGVLSKIKNGVARFPALFTAALSSGLALVRENAKRLAFSGGVSVGVAAFACALLMSTCSIGCQITAGGQTLGVVKNKADYERLLLEVNREIGYVFSGEFIPEEVSLHTRLIPKGAFESDVSMKEKLKATDPNMLPAYAVYAGEEILFSMPNEASAVSVLEAYMDEFTGGDESVSAEFCESVSVARRFVPKKSLKTTESALQALKDGRMTVHQLSEGETLGSVAEVYGISVDDILKTNAIPDPDAPGLRQLKLYTGEPLLSVKTVERKTIEEEIPFETVTKADPNRYEGTVFVEQEGAFGSRTIDAYVTMINGVETGREVISETLLRAQVDRIVKEGTKEAPSPLGTGKMVLPASGSLSSRYGSRWGRNHNGVDLSAPVGTDIYAADNGTVIYSAYNNGGYGYLLQLDHGNGIVTYYGHCSELLVPEGTVVAKGDLIARVGNTGRSTGPHLHFEVRVNGTPTDPAMYLNELS